MRHFGENLVKFLK